MMGFLVPLATLPDQHAGMDGLQWTGVQGHIGM